jgi:hypothetical protein
VIRIKMLVVALIESPSSRYQDGVTSRFGFDLDQTSRKQTASHESEPPVDLAQSGPAALAITLVWLLKADHGSGRGIK